MTGDRTIAQILVSVGRGIGFHTAYDMLRPGLDHDVLDKAAVLADEMDGIGEHEAAAAVREALRDFHAGVHRDPARAEGLIDLGDVQEVDDVREVEHRGE